MDQALIEEKIESLRRCVTRIEQKRVASARALEDDWDTQDILTVNLTRAVQICVDIAAHLIASTNQPPPDTMAGAIAELETLEIIPEPLSHRLQGAVGFRNIAIHAYRSINWEIVHAITHDHLDDFRTYAQAVLEHAETSRA